MLIHLRTLKKAFKRKHLLKTKEIMEASNDELEPLNDTYENIETLPKIYSLIFSMINSMLMKTGRPFLMIAVQNMKGI